MNRKPAAGLALDTVNHDELLAYLPRPAIIANDLILENPDDKELLLKYLLTNYESSTFSMVPQCDCGTLVGGYLRGKTCPHCHSTVQVHTERPIESNVAIRVPEGVDYFISPIAYFKIASAFEYNKVDVIRWICDVHYKGNFNDNSVIVRLRELGVKRGYNNFVRNFWYYIDTLLSRKMYNSQSDKRKEIKQWLEEHQKNIFSKYLLLPNRISLVTEKTPTGRYSELGRYGGAVEAALTIAGLNSRAEGHSLSINESVAYKCVSLLSTFYNNQRKYSLGKKHGWIRKHICGTRMIFTARNVITSLHLPHQHDELHIPWAMAIGLLRLHLTNKFLRDGYSPNEIAEIINGSVNVENPQIRQYFNELLAESKHGRLPCLFNRNPTLLRGSIQLLYISKIKDNVNDNTISLSTLILKPFNADFDGDQMSLYYIGDEVQYDQLKALATHTSVFSTDMPYTVSGLINLPSPIYSTLWNFIRKE